MRPVAWGDGHFLTRGRRRTGSAQRGVPDSNVSQQTRSPYEDMILAFIVVFIIGGIAFVIWTVFRFQLLEALRWIRLTEMQLGLWTQGDIRIEGYRLSQWMQAVKTINVKDWSNVQIRDTTVVAIAPIRWGFVLAIAAMALAVMFKGPTTKYRRRMGLEGLMREQAKSFPTITPFVDFDPRDLPFRAPGSPVPAQLPLFAEALSPEEWLAYHEVTYIGGHIDGNRAWQALGLQLGRRWEGPLKLQPYAQGLYAAFALKAVRKRKDCDALLAELALSWTAAKGFRMKSRTRAKIRKIITDPKIGGAMESFANLHAYENTAMLRCLMRARAEGGVLAPSEFVWLRGVDRHLWYPLNNLGRKSYMAEAAGAMVHFTNELIAAQKIPTPRFDEVIRGLDAYMKSGSSLGIPERAADVKHAQRFKAKRKKRGR